MAMKINSRKGNTSALKLNKNDYNCLLNFSLSFPAAKKNTI